ncbi:MAG: response regulator [Sphingomonadales bacterium]|nr:response regulator [Sphingomonadales bacterium]
MAGTRPAAIDPLALRLVIAACILVWALLLGETVERDWVDWPFHLATALTQLAIGVVAARMLRQARAQASHERAIAGELATLLRAKETAESVNQAKSRYLANVSHEIRSPLNSIYGYAQLVESDYGVEAREAARVIRRCAEHMSSLIEGLLDISQVEHGVLRVNTETVRLEAFLTQVIRMAQPSAAAKGLRLDLVTEGRLPEFVRLDQGRLRQVLINLLTNAIKYTDRGAVTLYLRYQGQIATIEVRDTGPGISAEDREAIFDPFERGHGAQVTRPGAGLGLSIARAITSILGGSLELAESTSLGSVFRITLMLGEVVGNVIEAHGHRQITGYHGRERRVLVVDDDAEQRGFVAHLLTRIGFDVATATDGEGALAIVRQADFDLVILDITMPGLSGWQVAAKLREIQPTGLQILILSGNSSEMHGPEFRSQLHDHFLIKPVELNALTDAIGGLLDLSWIMAAVDEPQPVPPPEADSEDDAELAAQVRQIRDLLRIGYLRGIEEAIRKLEPKSPQLARQLFEALDRFDLAALGRILDGVSP